MGNAQRLPNGNTLITESSFGRFFEVTKEGEIVWEYVNPFFGKPFFGGPPTSESNQVFRPLRSSAAEVARARGQAETGHVTSTMRRREECAHMAIQRHISIS